MINIKDIIILKDVKSDLNRVKDFYNRIEDGVGDYFWDSLVADIESLRIYAGIHNKKYGLYRMFAKRFPYAVYFLIVEDKIIVYGVFHCARNPKWLEDLLDEREAKQSDKPDKSKSFS